MVAFNVCDKGKRGSKNTTNCKHAPRHGLLAKWRDLYLRLRKTKIASIWLINSRIETVRSHICSFKFLVMAFIFTSRISVAVSIPLSLWYFTIFWFWHFLFQIDITYIESWVIMATTFKMAWVLLRDWFSKATRAVEPIKKKIVI